MFYTFLVIFSPFGIGLQPTLQTNYAFAQMDINLINDEDKKTENSYPSTFSSPSALKSKLDSSTIRFVSNKSNESSSAPLASQSSIELSSDSSSQSGGQSSSKANGDFNGDGFDDLAIGVALEDVDIAGGSLLNAGAVNIIYGSSNGLNATSPIPNQFWTQNNVSGISEFRDRFGASLSSGDFNRDGFDDLAIGVTLEGVQTVHGGPTIKHAGAVNVIYGSSNGLNATSPIANQFWTQNKVGGFPGTSEFFGTSLAAGDFNGDAIDDLAIGVPYEDVVRAGLTRDNAGAINVIYGSSNGLSATSTRPSQFWTQDTADVDDYSDEGDHFGEFLTSGDFNDDAIDDLAIGVPYEDFASGPNAGSNLTNDGIMQVIYGSGEGLSATLVREDQRWTQSFANIEDFAEQYDEFGSALTTGDFNGDAIDDLAIGVSGESVYTSGGTIVRSGAVNVIYGSSYGLNATSPIPNQFWTQAIAGANELPDELDSFGLSVASGDFNNDSMDDLAIGVPNESVNVGSHIFVESYGAVNVIYGSSAGLSTDALSPGDGRAAQLWTQNSTNVDDVSEYADFFGRYLKTGDFNGDAVDDLVIGAHGEGNYVSGVLVNDAGAVNVIYGSVGIAIGSGGLSATVPLSGIGRDDQLWTQDTEDVEDHLEFNDYFGGPVA